MTGRCDVCMRPKRLCTEGEGDCLQFAVAARDATIMTLELRVRELERQLSDARKAADHALWGLD